MWVESPHRERQQSAKSWGYGGKAPVAGHRPALSAHCTVGILSFSIATRRDRAAAPKAPSTFGSGAPSYNALITRGVIRRVVKSKDLAARVGTRKCASRQEAGKSGRSFGVCMRSRWRETKISGSLYRDHSKKPRTGKGRRSHGDVISPA
jgi:hypothetical protein